MNFGKALRKSQELTGIRSAELAESMGVHRQQIHKWRYKDDARLSLVIKVCKELNMHPISFLDLANDDDF